MTAVLDPEFTPLRDGYTYIPSYPAIEAKFWGLTKKRVDHKRLHKPHKINVNWVLNSPQQYTRFMGFFRTTLQNGTLAFLMDIVTDVKTPLPHRCRSLGRLPKLTQMRGNTFYVSCDLEVDVNHTVTGLIKYISPDTITIEKFFPFSKSYFNPGDTIQILEARGFHPDGNVFLDLDGSYIVDSVNGIGNIVLTSPELVNTDWTVLAGLSPDEFGAADTGNVISTITKIPQP